MGDMGDMAAFDQARFKERLDCLTRFEILMAASGMPLDEVADHANTQPRAQDAHAQTEKGETATTIRSQHWAPGRRMWQSGR